MFEKYAAAVGDHIVNVLKDNGIDIYHLKECYNYWGLDKDKMEVWTNKDMSMKPYMVVDFDYYFLTDYKMKKYYTEAENGMFHFWEFDYKNNYPTSCMPFVVIKNIATDKMKSIERILTTQYIKDNVVRIKHPILSENIILNLQISEVTNVNNIEENILNIYMKSMSIPWFVKKTTEEEFKNNQKINMFVMKQVEALTMIWNTCKDELAMMSSDENEEATHEKEKAICINSNRIELLKFAEIPEERWAQNDISWIYKRMQLKSVTINDIILEMAKEDDERKREIEQEKQRLEQIRQEKMRQLNSEQFGEYMEPARCSEYERRFYENTADIRKNTKRMEELENDRIKREWERESDERRRRSYESRRQFDAIVKANKERRSKGQPELPLPRREYW